MGYCLTADTSQQKMLLLVGPRRSGKGTLGRVLTSLVGSGNVAGPSGRYRRGPLYSVLDMPRNRLRLVACWLAAVTVLVSAVATSAGMVRCEGPEGAVTLEAGCEHEHCETEGLQTHLASHDHDGRTECACIDCECVDESAAVMVDPGYGEDLVDLRSKIDVSKELVEGVLSSVESAIESGPIPNAAEYYLAAADLVKEAEAANVELLEGEGAKFMKDILVLMRTGSACEWCDFSAARDTAAYVMPDYATGLQTSVALMGKQAADSPDADAVELVVQLFGVAEHLSGDGTFASSALALQAIERVTAILRETDPVALDAADTRKRMAKAMDEMTGGDPLGWGGATRAARLVWRAKWAERIEVDPMNARKTYALFTWTSAPELAWLGVLSLLDPTQQDAALARIDAFSDGSIDTEKLRAAATRTRDLIVQNNQDALTALEISVFDDLFPTAESMSEAWQVCRQLVDQMTSSPDAHAPR